MKTRLRHAACYCIIAYVAPLQAVGVPPLPSSNIVLPNLCLSVFETGGNSPRDIEYEAATSMKGTSEARHVLAISKVGSLEVNVKEVSEKECATSGLQVDQLELRRSGQKLKGAACLSTDIENKLLKVEIEEQPNIMRDDGPPPAGLAAVRYCSILDNSGTIYDAQTVRYGPVVLVHVVNP